MLVKWAPDHYPMRGFKTLCHVIHPYVKYGKLWCASIQGFFSIYSVEDLPSIDQSVMLFPGKTWNDNVTNRIVAIFHYDRVSKGNGRLLFASWWEIQIPIREVKCMLEDYVTITFTLALAVYMRKIHHFHFTSRGYTGPVLAICVFIWNLSANNASRLSFLRFLKQ